MCVSAHFSSKHIKKDNFMDCQNSWPPNFVWNYLCRARITPTLSRSPRKIWIFFYFIDKVKSGKVGRSNSAKCLQENPQIFRIVVLLIPNCRKRQTVNTLVVSKNSYTVLPICIHGATTVRIHYAEQCKCDNQHSISFYFISFHFVSYRNSICMSRMTSWMTSKKNNKKYLVLRAPREIS